MLILFWRPQAPADGGAAPTRRRVREAPRRRLEPQIVEVGTGRIRLIGHAPIVTVSVTPAPVEVVVPSAAVVAAPLAVPVTAPVITPPSRPEAPVAAVRVPAPVSVRPGTGTLWWAGYAPIVTVTRRKPAPWVDPADDDIMLVAAGLAAEWWQS